MYFLLSFFVACCCCCCCQYGRLRINDDLLRAHDNELRSSQGDSRPEFEGSRGRYGGGGGGGGGGRGRDGDGSYRGKSKGGASGGRGGSDRRDARKNMRNAAHRAVPGFPVSSAFWFFHLESWLNCPFLSVFYVVSSSPSLSFLPVLFLRMRPCASYCMLC